MFFSVSEWPHCPLKPCWESRAISWSVNRQRYAIESPRAGDPALDHVRLGAWGSKLFGMDLPLHSAYSAAFGKMGVWICLLAFFFFSFLLRRDSETRCPGKTINS